MNVPYPYETQRKVHAYRNDDGTYRLHGPTFHIKERIKELGGLWNGSHWNVPQSAVLQLKPLLMIKVRTAKQCHEDEHTMYATHKEVQCGYMRLGCSLCDTPASCGKDVEILEVIEKDVFELVKQYDLSLIHI